MKRTLLRMVAGFRRFVRRASRHLIRIRIQTTIVQQFDPEVDPPETVPPAEPAAPAAPCLICQRHPRSEGLRCFLCSNVMPGYLRKFVARKRLKQARAAVQAWQDAAPNN